MLRRKVIELATEEVKSKIIQRDGTTWKRIYVKLRYNEEYIF